MYLIEITVELPSEAAELMLLVLESQSVYTATRPCFFLYQLKKIADKCAIKMLCGFAHSEVLPWASFLHHQACDRPADKNIILDM